MVDLEFASDPNLLWRAVTVRVAWDLRTAGLRVAPALLAEARRHVFLSLPSPGDLSVVEDLASELLRDFLARARTASYLGGASSDSLPPQVDIHWRHSIEKACDNVALVVLRLVFGDGFSTSRLAMDYSLDPSTVQAAMDGLRMLARAEVSARTGHQAPLRVAWLDALLARIANASGAACPPPARLLHQTPLNAAKGLPGREAREHIDDCPRCARMLRLIRAGILSHADLEAPSDFPFERQRLRVLALHFLPRFRCHRQAMVAALGSGARAVEHDSVLVDLNRVRNWRQIIEKRVRMGLPPRDQLRGGIAEAPGFWGRWAVAGPAPVKALDASRSRTWGEVDEIRVLPAPLPPPPNVARLWSTAIGVGMLALAAGVLVLIPDSPPASYPLTTRVHPGGGGITVRFDVDDEAYVYAYTVDGDRVEARLESTSKAEKASLATGAGDYMLVALADELILVSSSAPLDALHDDVALLVDEHLPPRELRQRLKALYGKADIAVFQGDTVLVSNH